MVSLVAGIHQRDGVGALEGFKFRAIGILIYRMDFFVVHDHLLHKDFGMALLDLAHQLPGALKEQIDIRLVGAGAENLVFLFGGDIKGLVGNAGFCGHNAVSGGIPDGVIVKPVDGDRAFFVILVCCDGQAAVKQSAEQGKFSAVHIEFVGLCLRYRQLCFLCAGIQKRFFRLFCNQSYIFHISGLLS